MIPRVTPSEGMAYHQVMFNALYYFTPPDSRIRPFGTGGVGFTNYAPAGDFRGLRRGHHQARSELWGRREDQADLALWTPLRSRQATTPKPFGLPLASGWLRETEISAGFGVFF